MNFLTFWDLMEKYIEVKLEYEFASREVGEDGYTDGAISERKQVEEAIRRIKDSISNSNSKGRK